VHFSCVTFVGGGTGFVGRNLQKCLRKKGHTVKLISRNPQKNALTWVSLRDGWYLEHFHRLVMKS